MESKVEKLFGRLAPSCCSVWVKYCKYLSELDCGGVGLDMSEMTEKELEYPREFEKVIPAVFKYGTVGFSVDIPAGSISLRLSKKSVETKSTELIIES
jgi:hypothetical protein